MLLSRIGPETPGPVAQRVQSASRQAQQVWEPTWIPRETDRRLSQDCAAVACEPGSADGREMTQRPQDLLAARQQEFTELCRSWRKQHAC
ncbi:hypothetical protein [Streptomyces sp. ECR2.10]|uniref:hypothetical protein n=1 Tax=Streptomyces sp. ECR2.10 TaxID=3461012 RepID=UPI0040411AF9